jgi:hypothetical protein
MVATCANSSQNRRSTMGPVNTEKNRDFDYKRPLPQRSMGLEPRALRKTRLSR